MAVSAPDRLPATSTCTTCSRHGNCLTALSNGSRPASAPRPSTRSVPTGRPTSISCRSRTRTRAAVAATRTGRSTGRAHRATAPRSSRRGSRRRASPSVRPKGEVQSKLLSDDDLDVAYGLTGRDTNPVHRQCPPVPHHPLDRKPAPQSLEIEFVLADSVAKLESSVLIERRVWHRVERRHFHQSLVRDDGSGS